jgi:hypothetical protein
VASVKEGRHPPFSFSKILPCRLEHHVVPSGRCLGRRQQFRGARQRSAWQQLRSSEHSVYFRSIVARLAPATRLPPP